MSIKQLARALVRARQKAAAAQHALYVATQAANDAEHAICEAERSGDVVVVDDLAIVINEEWYELPQGQRVTLKNIAT